MVKIITADEIPTSNRVGRPRKAANPELVEAFRTHLTAESMAQDPAPALDLTEDLGRTVATDKVTGAQQGIRAQVGRIWDSLDAEFVGSDRPRINFNAVPQGDGMVLIEVRVSRRGPQNRQPKQAADTGTAKATTSGTTRRAAKPKAASTKAKATTSAS